MEVSAINEWVSLNLFKKKRVENNLVINFFFNFFNISIFREAIDFFNKTCALNQIDRMSSEQALNHIWISG